jgi:hypothetical protein
MKGTLFGPTLALLENIILGWKGLLWTNTLACYKHNRLRI